MSAFLPRIVAVVTALLLLASPVLALDDAHAAKAKAALDKGISFLRSTQNEQGAWTPQPGPAPTGLVVTVLLDQPDIKSDDPALTKGLEYILSKVREDGGIHDGFLENYNTSICLSALARATDRPAASEAIKKAQDYLLKIQWHEGMTDPTGKAVDASHRFYGGAGYGEHGRPDLSNTQFMLQALYDSGFDCNSEEYKRALVFITRLQGTTANTEFGDQIKPDGGSIYATSINKDKIETLETKAGTVTMEDGTTRLATYGSMTYAMFKSYLYAQLDRDDPRVSDAVKWIRNNYTLDVNPGMPEAQKEQGLYYYYMTFGRAMRAWGENPVETADGKKHDWQNDLIDALVSRQREDGSWTVEAERWMEGDANIITAYALIALTQAMK